MSQFFTKSFNALYLCRIERQRKAAQIVIEELKKPDRFEKYHTVGFFDPWVIFPWFYGIYDRDFERCMIDVLEQLKYRNNTRKDLAAEMVREMLCKADLCVYGIAPSYCFPSEQFEPLLDDLIFKWKLYSVWAWMESHDQ